MDEREQGENDSFYELHDKNAYNIIRGRCPNPSCNKTTLEYQIVGMEKEIFCTSCDFHETQQLRD